jgi:hypothetical protein
MDHPDLEDRSAILTGPTDTSIEVCPVRPVLDKWPGRVRTRPLSLSGQRGADHCVSHGEFTRKALVSLCKPHHEATKRRIELGRRQIAVSPDGWPNALWYGRVQSLGLGRPGPPWCFARIAAHRKTIFL